jgi:hypothetical protein
MNKLIITDKQNNTVTIEIVKIQEAIDLYKTIQWHENISSITVVNQFNEIVRKMIV